MENDEYIQRWIEGTLTEEEKKIFKQTDTYRTIKNLIDSLEAFRAPDYPVEDELERLKSGIKHGKSVTVKWLSPLYRMAAVLVVLAGIYFFFIHGLPTRVETSVGENRELFLPDSSRVVLNASSLLTYQEPHWDRKREVKLTGEAFFNVAHGSAFDVITEAGSIKVLGTQFNVKIRSDYFEVTCYEGLVSVEEGGKTTALSHHQMYRVINGENFRFSDVQDSSPGWINMESSFRSVPFIQVIREFERQYDVAIQTKQVDLDRLFTGRFINSDIELAINSITIPMNLSYQIIDDQNIVLSPDHN